LYFLRYKTESGEAVRKGLGGLKLKKPKTERRRLHVKNRIGLLERRLDGFEALLKVIYGSTER